MRSGYELFSVGSVSVKIHGSFIVLGVFMVLLAFSYGGTGADVGFRLLGPLVLFATVIFHELGHAAVARLLDVRVIDVILTPMGGMARIAGELKDPKQEGLIAVAGPAMNMLLALLTFGVLAILGRTNEVNPERIIYFLEERRTFLQDDLLVVFFGLNVLLAVLNLMPVFPCDGGRVMRAAFASKLGRLHGTRLAFRLGMYFSIFLIILPFVLEGDQWWIAPIAGIYFIFSNIKERVSVEAREGLGLGGTVFQFGQGFPPPSDNSEEAYTRDEVERGPLTDSKVIDTSATTRIVEEPDE